MYVQKLFQDRMNQSIRNARAISETITRNSEEIRRMYSDSYRKRQESQDRIHQKFIEYIRGVETYTNPYEGRPVQLPSGYQDAWVSGRGEYVLSNSPGYNPNVGDTAEWRRMDRR
jgi:alpha-beta hydrolase superfamily lysophospholipase